MRDGGPHCVEMHPYNPFRLLGSAPRVFGGSYTHYYNSGMYRVPMFNLLWPFISGNDEHILFSQCVGPGAVWD